MRCAVGCDRSVRLKRTAPPAIPPQARLASREDETTSKQERTGGVDFESRDVCCVPLRRRAWAVRHEEAALALGLCRPWYVYGGERETRGRRKLVQLEGSFSLDAECLQATQDDNSAQREQSWLERRKRDDAASERGEVRNPRRARHRRLERKGCFTERAKRRNENEVTQKKRGGGERPVVV